MSSLRDRDKFLSCDFSKWKVNMRVVIINRAADVRLVDQKKCPIGHTKYKGPRIARGYCSGCSYFMGCNTDGVAPYIGSEMSGCCWKMILKEEKK